jgi:hypothetical protein
MPPCRASTVPAEESNVLSIAFGTPFTRGKSNGEPRSLFVFVLHWRMSGTDARSTVNGQTAAKSCSDRGLVGVRNVGWSQPTDTTPPFEADTACAT